MNHLPYRPSVGMMIVNKDRLVFIAKRVDHKVGGWQMPQGGIEVGETPSKAAMREMYEEIGSNNGVIIAESKCWYSYDIPKFMVPKLWDGVYRGQKQKWFLIKFTGEDSQININTPNREFVSWKWNNVDNLNDVVIPFKRRLYSAILNEFMPVIMNNI
jgi:putative (di)nucleoside polyphosphate hydrolase